MTNWDRILAGDFTEEERQAIRDAPPMRHPGRPPIEVIHLCPFWATTPDKWLTTCCKKLPEELKKIFDEVSRETIALSDRMNREKEQWFIDQLSAHLETNYVEGEALEPFRQAVQPVYDYFIKQSVFTQEDVNRARMAAQGKP